MPTSPTPPSPVDLENLRRDVDAALEGELDLLEQELARLTAPAADLAAGLRRALAGGKRLRPAFCYWTWRAVGGGAGAPRSTVVRLGAALELFQAAALVHDDVMDASDLRRGEPAAHRRFESMHAARGWTGPADRFGEAAAILLGDLALVASERTACRALDDAPAGPARAARDLFDHMRTEVTVGQYLDVVAQAAPMDGDPAEEETRARAVIMAKSARYSVQHPMVLGALLAGGAEPDLRCAATIGGLLGEAFQLRDDLLGVLGDPELTGKPAGDDLREGKRTVLVARALAAGTEADRATLVAHLGERSMSLETVDALRTCLHRTGAIASVEDTIADLAGSALEGLRGSGWGSEAVAVLESLAAAATQRVS